MDLKTFKSGIEYVAKATNQRQSEPEPFLVQVSADGVLSLVSGNSEVSYIWRSPDSVTAPRQKFSVPSKMLVQATKALKGSKLLVSLSVTDTGLVVSTSASGQVNLPKVFHPILMAPLSRSSSDPVMHLPKGTLSRWSEALTTAMSPSEDASQFEPDGRICATNGYIMFDTHGKLTSGLPDVKWVRASFWNALRASDSDADITFAENGVAVQSGSFLAMTNYLGSHRRLPDMKQHYYPDGVVPPVYVVVDKKMFIGNVKAVASTTAKEQVFLSLPLQSKDLVIKGIQTGTNVVMSTIQGSKRRDENNGTIECSAKYMVDILNAIEGKQVIISWLNNPTHPLGIRDTAQQHEWFLLAPVVRQ